MTASAPDPDAALPAEIDARGLVCPLPVLRLRKVLCDLPAGGCVRLLADDPVAVVDIPHFCAGDGHRLLSMTEGEDAAGRWQVYLVEAGGGGRPRQPDGDPA